MKQNQMMMMRKIKLSFPYFFFFFQHHNYQHTHTHTLIIVPESVFGEWKFFIRLKWEKQTNTGKKMFRHKQIALISLWRSQTHTHTHTIVIEEIIVRMGVISSQVKKNRIV